MTSIGELDCLLAIDVSTDVLSQLSLFAEYSAASYCSNNINSTGNALSCEEGNCATVQAADTETLWEFDRYGQSRDFQKTFTHHL